MGNDLTQLCQGKITQYSAFDTLAWAFDRFDRAEIAFLTSFTAEDQVITDLLAHIDLSARIFTLDAGMLPRETLEILQRTQDRYGFTIQVVRPEPAVLDQMLQENGDELYHENAQKLCCSVRNVEPFLKTVAEVRAWICGRRQVQPVTCRSIEKIEWDEAFGLYQINPLIDWTEPQVWQYLRTHVVPYDAMQDRGYPSIGCAPCTPAVKPQEDTRASRWWENHGHKQRGLHVRDGRIIARGNA